MNDNAKAIDVVHGLLRTLISRKGSDLFITVPKGEAEKIKELLRKLRETAK